jgi:hypothetical protein
VQERVQSLEKNVKTKAFATAAERTGVQTERLLAGPPSRATREFVDFVDGTVAAGVLEIVPTDTEHINPTFACCRSVGMDVKRVQRSIADGCFQTMRSIALAQKKGEDSKMLRAAIEGLKDRVPEIHLRTQQGAEDHCPYFETDAKDPISCPFVAAGGEDGRIRRIRNVCADDGQHHKVWDKLRAALAPGK